MATEVNADKTEAESGSGEATAILPSGGVPPVAMLARIAAGQSHPPSVGSSLSLTTAADAMRDEEVERTRLFIRMGWALSVLVAATFPFVDAPLAMSMVFAFGLLVGVVVSVGYHRAFADPKNYTERALLTLSIICVINGHIGVLYYGAFSASPLIIMVGIHFVARTEAERVARWIFVGALVLYTAMTTAIITGIIPDPGVFASDRSIERASRAG